MCIHTLYNTIKSLKCKRTNINREISTAPTFLLLPLEGVRFFYLSIFFFHTEKKRWIQANNHQWNGSTFFLFFCWFLSVVEFSVVVAKIDFLHLHCVHIYISVMKTQGLVWYLSARIYPDKSAWLVIYISIIPLQLMVPRGSCRHFFLSFFWKLKREYRRKKQH